MENIDKIIFVIEDRGWKNGQLINFVKTSRNKLNTKLIDKKTLKKLNNILEVEKETNRFFYDKK